MLRVVETAFAKLVPRCDCNLFGHGSSVHVYTTSLAYTHPTKRYSTRVSMRWHTDSFKVAAAANAIGNFNETETIVFARTANSHDDISTYIMCVV